MTLVPTVTPVTNPVLLTVATAGVADTHGLTAAAVPLPVNWVVPVPHTVKVPVIVGIAFTVMPHVIERFVKKNPRVVLHLDEMAFASATNDFRELRDRKYDLILERGGALPAGKSADDLNIDFLFDDQLVIVAGAHSKWATRRRKIDLAKLVDEPWIMQAPHTWNYQNLAEACNARGLAMPTASLVTLSMSVITHFLADGEYISSMPRSVAYFKSLKVLPVDLPVRPWPVTIVTLKDRTLSPVVERFIECAREVAKSFAIRPQSRRA